MIRFSFLSLLFAGLISAEPVSLFDGKSLTGWDVREEDKEFCAIKDGALCVGSLEKDVPYNVFVASEDAYGDFELTFKVRLVKGGEGFVNSGIQVRSERVDEGKSPEMIGYQVDAGPGWWGKLYDESRRNRVLAEPVDAEALAGAVKDWEWNEYRIRCEGGRIRSWINGVAALDYTEEDDAIARSGRIGFQAHSGTKFLAQFKDIAIEKLGGE